MPDFKELRHIFLTQPPVTSTYTDPRRGGSNSNIPDRDRETHSKWLQGEFEKAWQRSETISKERKTVALPVKDGVYLEFKGQKGADLVVKSLEHIGKGIRLLNVHEQIEGEEQPTTATVYIPGKEKNFFIRKIKAYAEKDTKSGHPKNKNLVNSIEDIQLAVIDSFWLDRRELKPEKDKAWCEAWLRCDKDDTKLIIGNFIRDCTTLGIEYKENWLSFPERVVILVKVSEKDILQLIYSNSTVAEFRRAKETARFWIELDSKEQADWVKDLRERLEVTKEDRVGICIIDTGVNRGHELIKPILAEKDCHAVNPQWGVDDHHGHGTLMAGLAVYGDLQHVLQDSKPLILKHKLASAKILPPRGLNEPDLYGDFTLQAVSRVEINAPKRLHIGCMAVTSSDGRERGRPTSWSGAIDALTSGYHDGKQRLFIVSAGNMDSKEWSAYPSSNMTCEIHDPAQSWNALTIGAFTEKTEIFGPENSDVEAVAPPGGLSPFSTTSLTWDKKKWPVKPDVVLEGGNLGRMPDGFISEYDDLSLLSTYYKPIERQFWAFNATSAAAAQAAWMAAKIMVEYPEAWPETIRSLIVHSAEWTNIMKVQFLSGNKKQDYGNLLRICGYGVPNIERALRCMKNSLTMIIQQEIQPFYKEENMYRTKDMHIYELPWPKEVLLELGNTPVTLRVTLSYFIEPGPGEIGWKDKYRYASHLLRFDLNRSGENRSQFGARLNKEARNEEVGLTGKSTESSKWLIGQTERNAGSIHSDIWEDTGANLATSNLIGIFPVGGWWRYRAHLERWNRKVRYSLVVSISTPEQTVDLYTPVLVQLAVPGTVEISREIKY